jgi:hypothetical protein
MTQPDVALTDYGLALECSIFAYLLRSEPGTSLFFRFWFIVYFLSIALAAAVGGTVHGFYADPGTTGSRTLWPVTLIAVGITSLAGTRIGAFAHFDITVASAISRAAVFIFFLYSIVILFISDDFVVAILDYLPVVLFLSWVFMAAYRRTKRPPFLIGFVGLCTMLGATGVQQARLSIHPRYFNHNAVYHVLQAMALFMIFIAARDLTRQREASQ